MAYSFNATGQPETDHALRRTIRANAPDLSTNSEANYGAKNW